MLRRRDMVCTRVAEVAVVTAAVTAAAEVAEEMVEAVMWWCCVRVGCWGA